MDSVILSAATSKMMWGMAWVTLGFLGLLMILRKHPAALDDDRFIVCLGRIVRGAMCGPLTLIKAIRYPRVPYRGQ